MKCDLQSIFSTAKSMKSLVGGAVSISMVIGAGLCGATCCIAASAQDSLPGEANSEMGNSGSQSFDRGDGSPVLPRISRMVLDSFQSENMGLEATEMLLKILSDCNDETSHSFPASEEKLLTSIKSMVRMHKRVILDPETSMGTLYWVAFCIGEAARRGPISEASRTAVIAYHADFITCSKKIIQEKLYDGLSAQDKKRWANAIDQGLVAYEQQVTALIKLLVDDPMCPAFKTSPVLPAEEFFTKYLDKVHGNYPTFPSQTPFELMVTEEERYVRELEQLFEALIVLHVEYWFSNEVSTLVSPSKYWGYMKYSSEGILGMPRIGGAGAWPALVQLEPNPAKNQHLGWREGQDSKTKETSK